jgi:hypothetical protein
MAIAQRHNFAKLHLYNSPLTTLSYPTPTTTPGTSTVSLRAPQGKLTDLQLHSRRTKAIKQIQAAAFDSTAHPSTTHQHPAQAKTSSSNSTVLIQGTKTLHSSDVGEPGIGLLPDHPNCGPPKTTSVSLTLSGFQDRS